jgi:hypothetical protein
MIALRNGIFYAGRALVSAAPLATLRLVASARVFSRAEEPGDGPAMKRFALLFCLVAVALMLPGCPIYGDDSACSLDSDCPNSYLCDDVTGLCRPSATVLCDSPSQCASSETCGRDGLCHAGDCSWASIGCIAGYECGSESGRFECVRSGSNGGNGGAGGQGAGGAGGAGGSI